MWGWLIAACVVAFLIGTEPLWARAIVEWARKGKAQRGDMGRISPDGWYTDPATGQRHPERRSPTFDFTKRRKQ